MLFSIIILALSPYASGSPLGTLEANIPALFEKESTAVTFTFHPLAPLGRDILPRYTVIEIDADGKLIRHLGPIIDDGIYGDRKKNDGVLGRKFQLNYKGPGTRRFAVKDEREGQVISAPVTINIIRHPSFQELLSRIWGQISGRSRNGT